MKHMTWGKIAILGLFTVAGCYSYASEAINDGTYNTVQANPVVAVIPQGDSDQVLVRLVNAANNGAQTSYVVSAVGAGIAVHDQLNYRPLYSSATDTLVPTGDKDQQQYYVVGVTPGVFTFTLTPTSVNTAVSTTVKVIVVPTTLGGAALSVTSAASGAPVTVTAAPGTVFSDSSQISIPGASIGIISRAPDGSTITFAAVSTTPGGSHTPVTVSNVGVVGSPGTQLSSVPTGDSLALTAVPSPLPTTVSSTAPGAGQSITVTLSNTARFTTASAVTIGGDTAGITSISADSSSATILPNAYSAGNLAFTNVVLSAVPSVPIALTSDQNITVGAAYAGPTDPNSSSPANASTIKLIGSTTFALADNQVAGACTAAVANSVGGDFCLYYKVTLADANAVTTTLFWDTPHQNDMGVVLLSADGSTCVAVLADHTGQVAGNVGDFGTPTTCGDNGTATTLAPGTYIVAVANEAYTGAPYPAWIQLFLQQP